MASTCEVHVAGVDRETAEQIVARAAAEATRIEQKFSRYRSDNIVHRINGADGATIVVDDETARLIDYAAQLFDLSDGRFDITSGALREVWRFDGSDRLPTTAAVADVLTRVGWQKAQWSERALRLEPGMQIDFGGIGKEYAVDRAAALIVPLSTQCLLNFGGDLRALGASPYEPWHVGIEALDEPAAPIHRIDLECGALATSGDARRFLLKDGKRYGHVLDPTTGWPVENAPRSVTVAAPNCTEAGMLATLALLQGADAEQFLEAQGARYWCLR